jgi:hypothetical protein
MKVAEFFTKLATSELNNLSIGELYQNQIHRDHWTKLINHMNDGLIDIYTQFSLSKKQIIIEQVEGMTEYPLERKYAETSRSFVKYHFIKDNLTDPFEEDVISILEVYDKYGNKIPLDDSNHPASYFLVRPDCLQIPNPLDYEAIAVTYQAKHPKLEHSLRPRIKVLDQDIELPFYLETALQKYVASQIYSNMNGADNMTKGQELFTAYALICNKLLEKDTLHQTEVNTSTKLHDRGFI